MAIVAADPCPGYLMLFGRSIEPFPPFVIGFTFPRAAHRFDHISRIRHQRDRAGLFKVLKADRRCPDLSLLIGRVPKVFADGFPIPLEAEHGDRGGTRYPSAIAETRTVANYRDFFHIQS